MRLIRYLLLATLLVTGAVGCDAMKNASYEPPKDKPDTGGGGGGGY
jgi:hypothetical protein